MFIYDEAKLELDRNLSIASLILEEQEMIKLFTKLNEKVEKEIAWKPNKS